MPEKSDSCSLDHLFDEEFPDSISISDLCDCGRHKQKHVSKPLQLQSNEPFPQTDYMYTYQASQHPRPRSSKRPPIIQWSPKLPPMYISTNQKDAFKDLRNIERVKPIIHADTYEPSTEPFDGLTYYAKEFTPKRAINEPMVRVMPRRNLLHLEPVHFEDTTTSKEHFRRWVPQPNLCFSELPSFTGSILYPGKENLPVTTTRETFKGTFVPPPAQMKMPPPSIKLEGDHFFDTTHKSTYKEIDGDHRTKQIVQKETSNLQKRSKFCGVTQSQDDFPGFHGLQPQPPKPFDPPKPTIDLKFDNRINFLTENQSVFRGHDVKEHPAALTCKKVEEEYKIPSVKFESETSQKRDYQPIDLKAAENVRIRMPASSLTMSADARFDGRTMNHELFKDWGVQPKVRYGDFHENRPYIPSQQPFSSQSVTHSTFVTKPLEAIHRPRPKDRPISKSGEINFKTVYQEEFQKKQARMCRAEVYLIQQELKRRKRETQLKKLPVSDQPKKSVSAPSRAIPSVFNAKALA